MNEVSNIERLLNIKWSRFIPHEPTEKQLAALMLEDTKELLYGGALGGGKSDFLCFEALRFCDLPGFSAIIFRRQLTDLKQPNSLIPRVAEWLEPFRARGECRYVSSEHCWYFKTTWPGTDKPGPDARLQWGYIGDASVRERYQSAEYQLVAFDELGQWEDDTDYLFMLSRIRATVCPIHKKGPDGKPRWDDSCYICAAKRRIPLRMRAAMNPGPAWVKRRFQIVPDPRIYKSRRQALIAIQEGQRINWVGIHPYRKFIPAYLEDNPYLDEKNYRQMLREMTEEERLRLEYGNWDVVPNARFKRSWMEGRYINVYADGWCYLDEELNEMEHHSWDELKQIFMTVDVASTARVFTVEGEEVGDYIRKPSSTCIGVWGVTADDRLLWLDYRKMKREIPDVVEEIVALDRKWNPLFVKIEANGSGIGVAQYAKLAGVPVKKNIRKKDKLENSISAQMMMRYGQIYFPMNTSWIEDAEDEIFSWTGNPREDDDTVDILADAAVEITPRVAGRIHEPRRVSGLPMSVSMVRGGVQPRHSGWMASWDELSGFGW